MTDAAQIFARLSAEETAVVEVVTGADKVKPVPIVPVPPDAPRMEYRHPKHSLADLMRPGYFQSELRKRMHPGDEIHYILYGGSKLPSEWERGICIVESVPSHREQPLILAGLIEYPAPTPWRGDDDKSKAA